MKNRSVPTTYYHKPPMRFRNFEIHYNRDYNLSQIEANSHSYYEFYFLLSGSVTFNLDGRDYQMQAGDILLIAPDQYHQATINNAPGQPYERYVLWLDPEYIKKLSSDRTDLSLSFKKSYISSSHIHLTRDMQIVINNLLQMLLINSTSQEYGSDLLSTAYVVEVLVRIAKYKLFQQNIYFERSNEDIESNPIVLNALNYINEHIYENIKIQDITNYLYISKSYLSKLFSETMGLSVHQFITKKKLYLAKQDLLGGYSINYIYQKYGYENYTSFYRAFKSEFGLSPRSIKKKELS